MRENTTLKVMKTFKASIWESHGLLKVEFKSLSICLQQILGDFSFFVIFFKRLSTSLQGHHEDSSGGKVLLTNNEKLLPYNKYRIEQKGYFFPRRATLVSNYSYEPCQCGAALIRVTLEQQGFVLISLSGLSSCRFQVPSMAMCVFSRHLRFLLWSKIMHIRRKDNKNLQQQARTQALLRIVAVDLWSLMD